MEARGIVRTARLPLRAALPPFELSSLFQSTPHPSISHLIHPFLRPFIIP